MPAPTPESLFLQEQRRFRRLEVSLPVWITVEEALQAPPSEIPWELGYTRDLSLGGSKVIVPPGEEEQWRAAAKAGIPFVARFDSGETEGGIVPCFVRHVARDPKTGQLSLGVQFDESKAREARAAAVQSGLRTVKLRRRWQAAFAGAVVIGVILVGASVAAIGNLRAEVQRKNARIAALEKERVSATQRLAELSKPGLVATRAEGIQASFQRKQVQQTIAELTANIQALNNPKNMQQALKQREEAARQLGLRITPASTAARVQFAVAFPYGYNWPLVLNDLETILGRQVPHVVVFHDWSEGFPDLDAREARARGKVLQVTWEPWHFGNPNAVRLADIAAGKHDAYIDKWAAGARAFGGELWIRWGHEFNGNWYPWSMSANGANPQLWLKAYKHIRDRFQKAGASNVRWIWCINAQSVPNVGWNDPLKAYPGDNLVDVIAIDGYNFGTSLPYGKWQSFQDLFGVPYQRVAKLAPNKPIWIAETACSTSGGDKAAWIRQMDISLRRDFPRIESVTWFEAEKEADWRMVSSSQSLNAAKSVWDQPYYKRGVG
jgi:c-di-GMP-binding flagellar brake protein YcgR